MAGLDSRLRQAFAEHRITVVIVVGEGRHRAECRCGWAGPAARTVAKARRHGSLHRQLVGRRIAREAGARP